MRYAVIDLMAALVISLAGACVANGQRPATARIPWSRLSPGSYRVGYELRYVADSSRSVLPDTLKQSAENVSRYLGLRIWYPTLSDGRHLSFGDMIDLNQPKPWIANPLARRTMSIERYASRHYAAVGATPVMASDTAGLVQVALGTETFSIPRARPAPGKHPLLIFAGGAAHSTDENVGLWEYLASRGYIVVAFPTTAVEAETESAFLPPDPLGIETLTRDFEFVTSVMLRRTDVDSARIVVGGFSIGGAAALYAAARNTRYRAVFGLDPSFIAGAYRLSITNAPLFDARRLHVPLLEFHRADTTVNLTLERSALHSERTSYEIQGLDHIDFNSYVLLYGDLLVARRNVAARDQALAMKAAAYRSMVEITGRFLDAAIGTARRFDPQPAFRDVPDSVVSLTVFRSGQP